MVTAPLPPIAGARFAHMHLTLSQRIWQVLWGVLLGSVCANIPAHAVYDTAALGLCCECLHDVVHHLCHVRSRCGCAFAFSLFPSAASPATILPAPLQRCMGLRINALVEFCERCELHWLCHCCPGRSARVCVAGANYSLHIHTGPADTGDRSWRCRCVQRHYPPPPSWRTQSHQWHGLRCVQPPAITTTTRRWTGSVDVCQLRCPSEVQQRGHRVSSLQL